MNFILVGRNTLLSSKLAKFVFVAVFTLVTLVVLLKLTYNVLTKDFDVKIFSGYRLYRASRNLTVITNGRIVVVDPDVSQIGINDRFIYGIVSDIKPGSQLGFGKSTGFFLIDINTGSVTMKLSEANFCTLLNITSISDVRMTTAESWFFSSFLPW